MSKIVARINGVIVRQVVDWPIGYGIDEDGNFWSRRVRKRSPFGRGGSISVLGKEWKPRKPSPSGKYWSVIVRWKGKLLHKYVHTIVLEAFVGPRPNKHEARHFPDRDTSNNKLSNLSWSLRSVNHQDKHTHGTALTGEKNNLAKLTINNVRDIRRRASNGMPTGAIARSLGFPDSTVRHVVKGRSWRHVI